MTDHRVIGILGGRGGQLGRMLAASASLLNINVIVLDQGPHGPSKQIIAPSDPALMHIDGSFTDPVKVRELASRVDVLTVEIEHVNVAALDAVEKEGKVSIHPRPSTIRLIQDKLLQKQQLLAWGVPVAEFLPIESTVDAIHKAGQRLGVPLMLKSRTFAYDGRGNYVLRDLAHAQEALDALAGRPLYVEKWVPFAKEAAVMVVKGDDGEVRCYPAVETHHRENICHLVFAPLRSSDPTLSTRIQAVAQSAIENLAGAGVFGVEMFVMEDGTIYVNEIAPRPHNSGHYTVEACETSQYENHLRAILGLPLGSTALKVRSAAMLNLIGASSKMSELTAITNEAIALPGVSVHLYGKADCRKGRKMGHITIVADSDAQLHTRLRPLLLLEASYSQSTEEETNRYSPAPPHFRSGHSHPFPLVGVIMGSDSDLPVMLPAAHILDHFEVPYELTIVSSHRTPDRLVQYAKSASSRGLRVIIAGAGGAAHLPGMVASMTALPVIGVPVKGSSLDGVDSLYSIVQMPRGIPVATVAINNGVNAGVLSVRILSVGMPRLVDAMEKYLKALEEEVLEKVKKLEEVGWEKYEVKK